MRHWRLACWITVAVASTGRPARADDAVRRSEVDGRWMGAVHVALPTPARTMCGALPFAAQEPSAPSRLIEGVVTVASGSMRYVFDPSRDDRRIVTSEVAADSLASLFGRFAPALAMAVALGSGQTATVSLGGGGLDGLRDCLDVEGVRAGGN